MSKTSVKNSLTNQTTQGLHSSPATGDIAKDVPSNEINANHMPLVYAKGVNPRYSITYQGTVATAYWMGTWWRQTGPAQFTMSSFSVKREA